MRRAPGGTPEEVSPEGANVRSRVHEYGGGAWTVAAPDLLLYVDFADGRLRRLRLGGEAEPISPEAPAEAPLLYADMRLAPDGETAVCVRERHPQGGGEAANEIVALPMDGAAAEDPAAVRVLASGRDFYSFPRVSPDGATLAFTCWEHPNMPWDGTELWTAPLADPGAATKVAGGASESIFAPAWDAEGRLHWVGDGDGWWNLYRAGAPGDPGTVGGASGPGDPGTVGGASGPGDPGTVGGASGPGDPGTAEQLTFEEADLAHPQWLFGGATYAFLDGGAIALVRTERGSERLFVLDSGAERPRDLGLPFTAFGFPAISGRGSQVAFAAATPEAETAVVLCDLAAGTTEILSDAAEQSVDPAHVSVPRPIEFDTGDGSEVAHGFFYPPANAEFEAPAGELPPLIVQSHGGPTSHATPAFDLDFLFWTSRGFGVVDVNYRGSSGYGRAYREKLKGEWGVADTEDCVRAALHLAAEGEADRARLAIRGGSAGGYATLCALVFHDDLAAGASYYGVADTETLARDTHKFESRYLDGLIGPYPERIDLFRERSPIHHLDQLRSPLILFQGLEDKIVPPNQAEEMAAALAAKGVPHAYLAFEGEQHGFRRSETEIACLNAELYFYGRILNFTPADELTPIEITGLA